MGQSQFTKSVGPKSASQVAGGGVSPFKKGGFSGISTMIEPLWAVSIQRVCVCAQCVLCVVGWRAR